MWTLPPTDSVLHVLSFIAVAAQSMTAALAAGKRSMDWAGVCMLGAITALGGGTIRDVLLGHYPLVWVAHPIYLVIAGVAALVTIGLARLVVRLNLAFLVLDAIGLVVFTMAGCDVAWQVGVPVAIVIVSGMITGCAGGVLRDILCNEVPLLFRSELYASVSVVTGLFYAAALRLQLNDTLWAVLLTFVLGLTFRLLAIRYKWEMPKFVFSGEER
ncbi:trimeric intracellular cation channel family protein [Bradyrhizobium sp. CCBAU 51753]|uniref:trimeric intracellular cation channel family protein n=1 Tax=Bradyrhizobium sp. CCBAU 51753 TaxID=1325100 RepID=UPI00188D34A2|nr:trimeric intracellular cation channel family protein [Bradyrhizobium sp. CCBAU 51753]QOZ26531.1 trimeric intracellular cation channel family protein [Bradyrhizobium sp. CCBAU 51753]